MRNSFVVGFLVDLLLKELALGAFFGPIVGFFASWLFGEAADLGILKIDLTADQLDQAMKDPKWKAKAIEYYKEAGARLYTEEEKDVIRKKYLDALDEYVGFGDGLQNN